MSVKRIACSVLVCDGCKEDYENGEYTPHYGDDEEARELARDDDWRGTSTQDWCARCQAEPHTFVPDEDSPTYCARCGSDDEGSHPGGAS